MIAALDGKVRNFGNDKRSCGKRLGYLKPASRFDNKRGKLYPV